MLCDDFKTSDPPGNVNFGYGNRRRLALTSDLGSNPAGTAYYPRCVEMSELVGTMLVQINEGSFNFTGMCTSEGQGGVGLAGSRHPGGG